MKSLSWFLVMVLMVSVVSLGFAIPGAFTQTGRLLEQGSIANGVKTMSFGIYNAATAGTALWTTSNLSVSVSNGFYSANLSTIDPAVLFNDNLWLQITVNGEALSPRTLLRSAPMAMNAGGLYGLTGITANAGAGSMVVSGNGFQVLGGLCLGDLATPNAGTDQGAIRWNSALLQIWDGTIWTSVSDQ